MDITYLCNTHIYGLYQLTHGSKCLPDIHTIPDYTIVHNTVEIVFSSKRGSIFYMRYI